MLAAGASLMIADSLATIIADTKSKLGEYRSGVVVRCSFGLRSGSMCKPILPLVTCFGVK